MNMKNFQYAGLNVNNPRIIEVYNKLDQNVLIRVLYIPQATRIENHMLVLNLCKIAEGYIIQQMGGPRQNIMTVTTLVDVTLTGRGNGRCLVVYKKGWQTMGEIYTYATPNPINTLVFECLVAAAVEKYIKSVKKSMKERGWD